MSGMTLNALSRFVTALPPTKTTRFSSDRFEIPDDPGNIYRNLDQAALEIEAQRFRRPREFRLDRRRIFHPGDVKGYAMLITSLGVLAYALFSWKPAPGQQVNANPPRPIAMKAAKP